MFFVRVLILDYIIHTEQIKLCDYWDKMLIKLEQLSPPGYLYKKYLMKLLHCFEKMTENEQFC